MYEQWARVVPANSDCARIRTHTDLHSVDDANGVALVDVGERDTWSVEQAHHIAQRKSTLWLAYDMLLQYHVHRVCQQWCSDHVLPRSQGVVLAMPRTTICSIDRHHGTIRNIKRLNDCTAQRMHWAADAPWASGQSEVATSKKSQRGRQPCATLNSRSCAFIRFTTCVGSHWHCSIMRVASASMRCVHAYGVVRGVDVSTVAATHSSR
jgi:hypothetical protein